MDRVQLGCITAGIREKNWLQLFFKTWPKTILKRNLAEEGGESTLCAKKQSPEDTSSCKVLDLEVMQHNHADEASDAYKVMFMMLVNR